MCAIGGMLQWNVDSRDLSANNLQGRSLCQLSCVFCFGKHKSHGLKTSKIKVFICLWGISPSTTSLPPGSSFRVSLGTSPWTLNLKCMLHTLFRQLLSLSRYVNKRVVARKQHCSAFPHTGTCSLLICPFWFLTSYFIYQVPRHKPPSYIRI